MAQPTKQQKDRYIRDNLEKVKETKRASQKRGQEKRNEKQRLSRLLFPEKRKAHREVAKALKSGVLLKSPCWECGSVDSVSHHVDYSKPLDVIWLCSKHHLQLHTEHRGY